MTGLDTWGPWDTSRGDETLRVTAVPGQHGPALVHRALPPVMGSVLTWSAPNRGWGPIRVRRVYLTGRHAVPPDAARRA